MKRMRWASSRAFHRYFFLLHHMPTAKSPLHRPLWAHVASCPQGSACHRKYRETYPFEGDVRLVMIELVLKGILCIPLHHGETLRAVLLFQGSTPIALPSFRLGARCSLHAHQWQRHRQGDSPPHWSEPLLLASRPACSSRAWSLPFLRASCAHHSMQRPGHSRVPRPGPPHATASIWPCTKVTLGTRGIYGC